PDSTLFPYTTLFRSELVEGSRAAESRVAGRGRLLDQVEPVAAGAHGSRRPAPERSEKMSRPARILLAEDDRILRKAGEVSLKKKGYDVIPAVDGEDALAKARAEKPDLVLLDVMMPKMHGFDVLYALKGDPEVRDIPVIMLTN